MNRSSLLLCVGLLALLASCATTPADPADVAEMNRPLICEGKAQCDLWWRRAQAWVSEHAGFKIQTATDTVLETYSPPQASSRWAFQIVREPLSATSDRIRIKDSCGQIKLCPESEAFVIANFKRFVRGPAEAVAAAAPAFAASASAP